MLDPESASYDMADLARDAVAVLGAVTTPTLVIQGSQDPLYPPGHGRRIAELVPGADLVEIEGMGHALPAAVQLRLAHLVLAHTGSHTQQARPRSAESCGP